MWLKLLNSKRNSGNSKEGEGVDCAVDGLCSY